MSGRGRRKREREQAKLVETFVNEGGAVEFEALLPGEWRREHVEGPGQQILLIHRDPNTGAETPVCRVRRR